MHTVNILYIIHRIHYEKHDSVNIRTFAVDVNHDHHRHERKNKTILRVKGRKSVNFHLLLPFFLFFYSIII